MILQSEDNIGFKRPKHSSSPITNETKQNEEEECEDKEDKISKLQDELLIHILSLLPEKDANRTRILSNKWNHLCALLPHLRFKMPNFNSAQEAHTFHDFIDHTLALRRVHKMPIQRFSISFSENCDYNRVYDSLCSVVQSKVQELELAFPSDGFKVRFCWDLFKASNTLVGLTLEGRFSLDVPETDVLLFPCLKKLTLSEIYYNAGDKSFQNLISGCPVLEQLVVKIQCYRYTLDKFIISSSSLKRLEIYVDVDMSEWSYVDTFEVVVEALNLEYIYIWNCEYVRTLYSFTRPVSCLFEAHIQSYSYSTIAHIIRRFTFVKILTLNYHRIYFDLSEVDDLSMPVFPNMAKLVLGIDDMGLLLLLLYNMPNLEEISFLDDFLCEFNTPWDPPTAEAPPCLSYKVKKISILNQNQGIYEEVFAVIEYLLKHAKNLEEFTINAHNTNPKTREEVLKFHRCSGSCQVKFI